MRQRLFRVPTISTTAHAPFGVSSLPGVSALFATSPKRIHSTRNVPGSATVRPQAFSASRRFAPRSGSWACFIPPPRSGFVPVQGLLPLHSLPPSSGGACPLVVRTSLAPRPKPAATKEAPRLRGLHPCRGSCLRFGVTRPVGRSPLQVHAPPGVRFSTMTSAYPKPSAHGVDELAFVLTPSLAFSVLSPRTQAHPSPNEPTCSSF